MIVETKLVLRPLPSTRKGTRPWWDLIREASPIYVNIKCIELKHTHMHKLLTYSGNKIHSFRAFNMFILILKHIYSCRDQIDKNTYLERSFSHNQLHRCNIPPNHRPVCSSISQHHSHPLSWAWFPQGIRNTSRLIHSQGYKITQPSQHIWVYQAARRWKGWILS